MIVSRIDFTAETHRPEALPSATATLHRAPGAPAITLEMHTPEGTRRTTVGVDSDRDKAAQFAMATQLQEAMDGGRGTNSMIHEYFSEIRRLAD